MPKAAAEGWRAALVDAPQAEPTPAHSPDGCSEHPWLQLGPLQVHVRDQGCFRKVTAAQGQAGRGRDRQAAQ